MVKCVLYAIWTSSLIGLRYCLCVVFYVYSLEILFSYELIDNVKCSLSIPLVLNMLNIRIHDFCAEKSFFVSIIDIYLFILLHNSSLWLWVSMHVTKCRYSLVRSFLSDLCFVFFWTHHSKIHKPKIDNFVKFWVDAFNHITKTEHIGKQFIQLNTWKDSAYSLRTCMCEFF